MSSNDIDRLIAEAMTAEERALMEKFSAEPHFVRQTLSIFTGPNWWVNLILAVFQGVAFLGGLYAAWKFFGTSDVLSALHWGLPSVTLLLMAATVKMGMMPTIEANRVIRELKRIELQIARAKG